MKVISHKKEIKILACFWPILDLELNKKGRKPSRKSFSSSYDSSQLDWNSPLKVALSQKRLEDFYISKINIPNHYPEQKI
jgi:hypothetical protein